jgi:hypothetical protein
MAAITAIINSILSMSYLPLKFEMKGLTALPNPNPDKPEPKWKKYRLK